jgi:hypothetical protein
MSLEGINFPVYRKYKNNKSYFKIINPRLFEQVQVVGSKRFVKLTEAKLFPEMNFIRDLVLNYEGIVVEITEGEYLKMRDN